MICDQGQKSIHSDKILEDIDILLTNVESNLKVALEQVIEQIKRCRETAKQTVSNSSSQQTDKLHTNRSHADTTAHNIMHKVAMIKEHLAQSSTVFDRSTFVKQQLPDIQNELSQQTSVSSVSTYLQADVSKWKNSVTAWSENITRVLTTATTTIPQLSVDSLFTLRYLHLSIKDTFRAHFRCSNGDANR